MSLSYRCIADPTSVQMSEDAGRRESFFVRYMKCDKGQPLSLRGEDKDDGQLCTDALLWWCIRSVVRIGCNVGKLGLMWRWSFPILRH